MNNNWGEGGRWGMVMIFSKCVDFLFDFSFVFFNCVMFQVTWVLIRCSVIFCFASAYSSSVRSTFVVCCSSFQVLIA